MIQFFVCSGTIFFRLFYMDIVLAGINTRYIRALFSCFAMVTEPYRPAPLKRREGAHRVISNKDDIAFVIREAQ